MKHYYIILALVAFVVASLGFIIPWLVSQKDTILVLAGLAWASVVLPFVVVTVFKKLKGKKDEKPV